MKNLHIFSSTFIQYRRMYCIMCICMLWFELLFPPAWHCLSEENSMELANMFARVRPTLATLRHGSWMAVTLDVFPQWHWMLWLWDAVSLEDGERDGMGQLALNSEAQKSSPQEMRWITLTFFQCILSILERSLKTGCGFLFVIMASVWISHRSHSS